MRLSTLLGGILPFASVCVVGSAHAQHGDAGPGTARPAAVADRSPGLTAADASAWLDGLVPHAMATAGIPGAVVVVVKDGEVLVQKGYGHADIEQDVPVDPATTLFRPGSVSKLFTWTAVMQLVEQGRLDLDADINTYLEFAVPAEGRPITMRQVMTHTTGLANASRDLIVTDPKLLGSSLGRTLAERLPPQVHPPGTSPAYSNYATALAGHIVERVSGQSFDDYMETHILGPLGMTRSTFRQPLPARLAPFMAQRYDPGARTAAPFELVPLAPAGALAATGPDLAKFAIAHLREGAYGNGRILRPDTVRQMHAPQAAAVPGIPAMTLGFFESRVGGRRVLGHTGGTAGFTSNLVLFVEDDAALIFSFNGARGHPGLTALFNGLTRGFALRYLAVDAPAIADAPDPEASTERVRRMRGTYASSFVFRGPWAANNFLGQTVVEQAPDGGLLVPSLTGLDGKPLRWTETAPFVWEADDGETRLAAVVEDGRVLRWTTSASALNTPVGAWSDRTVWVPAAKAAFVAIVATLALWPVVALVRRHHGRAVAIGRRDRIGYVATWAFGALALVVGLWWTKLVAKFADITQHVAANDSYLILFHGAAWCVVVGLVLSTGWNLAAAWGRGRSWRSRAWAIVLLVAALVLARVAWLAGALSFVLNY